VSVIDTASERKVDDVSLSPAANPLQADHPSAIVTNQRRPEVYTVNSNSDTVSVLSARTRSSSRRPRLHPRSCAGPRHSGRPPIAGYRAKLVEVDDHAPDSPQPGPAAYMVRVGHYEKAADAQAAAAQLTTQGFQKVHVDYTGDDGTSTGGPWQVHVLDVDPRRFKGTVAPVLATDVVPGRETVSSIDGRTDALAGINGGYFVIGDSDGTPGDLAGISMVGGDLVMLLVLRLFGVQVLRRATALPRSASRRREQRDRVPDRPLAGRIRRTGDERGAECHRGRSAAVEVHGVARSQGAHHVRFLGEAQPVAVAGSTSVHRDEQEVARTGDAGERARVAPDAEAVEELRVLGVGEALAGRVDCRCAAAQEPRPAVHRAELRFAFERPAVGCHARAHVNGVAGLRVRAQPVRSVSGPGEHRAAGRDRTARGTVGEDAASVIQHSLDLRGRIGRDAEGRRELDELGRIGAGHVVQRALGGLVAAHAAAGADEAGPAVPAIQLAPAAVVSADRQDRRELRDLRAAAVAVGEQQVGASVDRLAARS